MTGQREVWLEQVAAIRHWKSGVTRAPHKPLLLLYALGGLAARDTSRTRYVDAEPALERLLAAFGPPRKSTMSYPFRRLANDGVWVVDTGSGEDPGDTAAGLRRQDAVGRLAPAFEEALRDDPALMVLVARMLLDANWPESMHRELLEAVGLDLDAYELAAARERVDDLAEVRRRRDAGFRQRVLMAYEYRCAFCGYDGRLETAPVGLDAAHVRWWAYDGPDTVANALCLCSFHHRLLDLGVLGMSGDHEVRVSKHFVGHSDAARALVLALVGRPVGEPQPGEDVPDPVHVAWHTDQVFRQPARAG